MTAVLLLGAGTGLGLWLLSLWAVPPRRPLGVILDRLTAQPAPTPMPVPADADPRGWAARAG